jgi:hypothetical protein
VVRLISAGRPEVNCFFFFFARNLGGESFIRCRIPNVINNWDVRGKEKQRGGWMRYRTVLDAFSAKNESVFVPAVSTRCSYYVIALNRRRQVVSQSKQVVVD